MRNYYSTEFNTLIFFCPWCGTKIGKHPSEEGFSWDD